MRCIRPSVMAATRFFPEVCKTTNTAAAASGHDLNPRLGDAYLNLAEVETSRLRQNEAPRPFF
jgi:hypothetical protein